MKIAVTAKDNKGLATEIDPHFGRANYFAIVDLEEMDISFLENKAGKARSGAGVQAAQTISEQGVEALISGNFGPKAFSALKTTDLKLYQYKGTIQQAVESLKKGELAELTDPTNNAHAGLQ